MQVFQLYITRVLKKKRLIGLISILPVLMSIIYIKLNQPYYLEDMASMLLSFLGLILVIAIVGPNWFDQDRKTMTTDRILLSTYSKLSMYLQTLAAYLLVAWISILAIMLTIFLLLPESTILTIEKVLLLLVTYSLLIIITTGLSLLLLNSNQKSKTWKRIFQFVIVCILLLGLFYKDWGFISLDYVILLLPTYWVAEITHLVINFNDLNQLRHSSQSFLLYLIALIASLFLIIFLLIHHKTRVF